MHYSSRKGFTLIELLVVIAIIAILAVVVILTLNPAELLRQSRDSNRLSDMSTLGDAINIYNTSAGGTAGYSLGLASTSELSMYDPSATSTAGDQCQGLGMPALPTGFSYDCSASGTYRAINDTGWIPINFASITGGSPISALPVDPINTSSSGFYYTYETNGSTYELSATMESAKYAKTGTIDGSADPTLAEVGTGLSTLPDLGQGLLGYWPLNEGQGTTLYDWSGSGSNGSFVASPTWTQGHVWASGLQETNGNDVVFQTTSAGALPTSTITVALWENMDTSTWAYAYLLSNNWGSNPGAWLLNDGVTSGVIEFSMMNAASVQYSAICSGVVSLNTWYFIVATYDGSTIKTYINGSLCASMVASIGPLSTGHNLSSNPGPGSSPVISDDIRVYDYALSATEIQAIYNAEK